MKPQRRVLPPAVAHLVLVRRMRRVFVLALSLTLAVATASAGDRPMHVTVHQLLATSRQFDGRRVSVTGYHHTGPEDSSLFASERDALTQDPKKSIWLDWTVESSPLLWRAWGGTAPSDIDGRIVRVVGTFRYEPHPFGDKSGPSTGRPRGYGSWGLWGRTIQNITYFQRAR
jgi:hypothetical protein